MSEPTPSNQGDQPAVAATRPPRARWLLASLHVASAGGGEQASSELIARLDAPAWIEIAGGHKALGEEARALARWLGAVGEAGAPQESFRQEAFKRMGGLARGGWLDFADASEHPASKEESLIRIRAQWRHEAPLSQQEALALADALLAAAREAFGPLTGPGAAVSEAVSLAWSEAPAARVRRAVAAWGARQALLAAADRRAPWAAETPADSRGAAPAKRL
jgi:hypothetical protein